jgi:predicted phosphoribosyltransferase
MAEIVEEPSLRGRVHVFDNRFHAGELLAEKLGRYRSKGDALVLAIPAGGVQVGFIVAERLGVPLDIVVTRKLHVPWNREAGFGAVSWDGLVLLNEPLVAALGLTRGDVDRCVAEEAEVIERRLNRFRGDRPFPDLTGRTALVVDDGLASGFSMLATLKALRRGGVGELVVAVPTAPESSIDLVRPHADVVYCLNVRSGPFFAVADAYRVWYDLGDKDVVELLRRAGSG